ncbi:hypothetical protein [Winogradskyella forsetii]|uniref:hypothetical protein n=1 Tax=Winogradskyella forsetii TaxID=2686077 RepID=UPI0015BB6001|nr:hypothetical protein [Winogradskyella forsetii]
MKKVTKLLLITMLVIFASCQKEDVKEDDSLQQEAELNFKDGNVISDGLLEEEELMFNEKSKILMEPKGSMQQKSYGSCTPDIDGLEAMLPEQVTVTTTEKPGDNAYFEVTISDTSGFLSGTEIPAWCADQDLSLENNETASFDVYSTYGDLPAGVFEHPENFDKVNWLMNQSLIGMESSNGLGEYTFGHIQYAIWLLIDDSVCQECTYLTAPTGDWNNDGNDIDQAEEIRDLALASGGGFTPSCGEQMAIVLVPDGKQSIIISKEVEEEEVPCEDCTGKVTDLTLKWDWHNDYRVKVYQRYENTCYASKIFDQVVGLDDEISLSGINHDGTFGSYLYIYVGNCYYTKIKTNCYLNIGPGYKRGVLEVVSGESSLGGELCEYEPPYQWCWWW